MQNRQIIEDVSIPVFGRHHVAADLYKGHSCQPERPCIIWLHGGGYVGGDKGQFSGLAAYLSLRLDAVCISVNYRTANHEPYPAPIIDCLGVCHWAHQHREALSIGHIYLAGGSPGANIAAMSMVNGPEILRQAGIHQEIPAIFGGILLNPILDMNSFYTNNLAERDRVDLYLGKNDPDLRKVSSPVFYPMGGTSFLILQGADDTVVGFEAVECMERAFVQAGSAVSVKQYRGEAHGWFNQAEKMALVAHDIEEYISLNERECLYGIKETGSAV